MNILGNHIETNNLILCEIENNKMCYTIIRKQSYRTVGTVSFSVTESNKICEFSSFHFQIDILKQESKHDVTLLEYCLNIIEGLISNAFNMLDIESVLIDCNDLSNSIIDCFINKEFPKKKSKIIVVRSKWAPSNDEFVSIALFDILGFSNLIENHGNDIGLKLYRNLVKIIKNKEHSGVPIPVPINNDWTSFAYVTGYYGNVHISYFSDTFIIWTDYIERGFASWLASGFNYQFPLLLQEPNTHYYPIFYKKHGIYLSFLEVCMDFFCQSIINGIPLRGCVASGLAKMDNLNSTFVGKTLIEAARGEAEQNSIGIAFGKSFNNHHPVLNEYFIPYSKHKKNPSLPESFLSPMAIDYPRHWRKNYADQDFSHLLKQMNIDQRFTHYYDNSLNFFEFSEKHENWYHEINRDGINNILDYYKKTKEWYNSVVI